MNRITGIFATDGSDTFTQSDYGKTGMKKQLLCTFEKEDCKYIKNTTAERDAISGASTNDLCFVKDLNKVYKYTSTDDGYAWNEVRERMYGKWLDEAKAIQRMDNYFDDPTNVADNRYLHINF